MVAVGSLLIVVAGLGLLGYVLLSEDSPLLKAYSASETKEEFAEDAVAKSTTLKLTIPAMDRVEDLNVYDAPFDDESALEAGAQHVQDTGFPWEDEPNVFIAGHRLGFPGTDSYLVFWDLDELEEGDEVFLTDSDDTRYTYEVFENFVTGPYDWSVTEPVPGKNIVTLQTCTLPDYSDRIIVQAELTEVEPAEEAEPLPERPDREPIPEDDPLPEEPYPGEPLPDAPIFDEPIPDAPIEPIPDAPVPVEPLPGTLAGPLPEDLVLPEPIPEGPAPAGPPGPLVD
ncbi:MAG: sortase [Actinomycetota bacterium]|nr:sortase [Actinomycetota bacterium]